MQPIATCIVLLAVVTTLRAQPPSRGALTPQIEGVLQAIKVADKGQLAISEEDGRFLRVLVAARAARSILEIGAASGYSAIWLGLGARETGGHVLTIEYDPQRAGEAVANITRAGLGDVVHVVRGDAFKEIPKLTGMFDFVFLDAWKPDYQKFFDLVFPRMSPGALLAAHNVVNKKDEMSPFLNTIHNHPRLLTSIVSPASEGMSVSYKTR
jgi:predicted O-methyltransferase YrrM